MKMIFFIYNRIFKIFTHKLILSFFLFISFYAFGQKQKENYTRFLDSAEYHIFDKTTLSLTFLDSIPNPTGKSIKGNIASYFELKARAYHALNETSKEYQNYLLALKYAEIEKNYDLAGDLCVEIFLCNNELSKNEIANSKYLRKAKDFYVKSNNTYGLLDIQQLLAFIKFTDGKSEESNKMILEHLDTYKNEENQFLYAMAIHMLSINYYKLHKADLGKKYYDLYKTLKGKKGILDDDFINYRGMQHYEIANYYYTQKNIDSSLLYINKMKKNKNKFEDLLIYDFYNINSKIYKLTGNLEMQNIYLDSLIQFEQKNNTSNLINSIKINESLSKSELSLEKKIFKNRLYLFIALLLLTTTSIVSVLLYKNRLKVKNMLSNFREKLKELTYLKSNQQKLTTKVHGLESIINNIKNEIKNISKLSSIQEQRNQILLLYKNIHIKSSDVLAKNENHLYFINELNVNFFTQIMEKHPHLNESEFIICYHIFMGFKNKEIAFFLNTSIRSIESKRYRIGKKINLEKQTSLSKHLSYMFKNTQNPK